MIHDARLADLLTRLSHGPNPLQQNTIAGQVGFAFFRLDQIVLLTFKLGAMSFFPTWITYLVSLILVILSSLLFLTSTISCVVCLFVLVWLNHSTVG